MGFSKRRLTRQIPKKNPTRKAGRHLNELDPIVVTGEDHEYIRAFVRRILEGKHCRTEAASGVVTETHSLEVGVGRGLSNMPSTTVDGGQDRSSDGQRDGHTEHGGNPFLADTWKRTLGLLVGENG